MRPDRPFKWISVEHKHKCLTYSRIVFREVMADKFAVVYPLFNAVVVGIHVITSNLKFFPVLFQMPVTISIQKFLFIFNAFSVDFFSDIIIHKSNTRFKVNLIVIQKYFFYFLFPPYCYLRLPTTSRQQCREVSTDSRSVIVRWGCFALNSRDIGYRQNPFKSVNVV